MVIGLLHKHECGEKLPPSKQLSFAAALDTLPPASVRALLAKFRGDGAIEFARKLFFQNCTISNYEVSGHDPFTGRGPVAAGTAQYQKLSVTGYRLPEPLVHREMKQSILGPGRARGSSATFGGKVYLPFAQGSVFQAWPRPC